VIVFHTLLNFFSRCEACKEAIFCTECAAEGLTEKISGNVLSWDECEFPSRVFTYNIGVWIVSENEFKKKWPMQ
jgi:hypothetical protein